MRAIFWITLKLVLIFGPLALLSRGQAPDCQRQFTITAAAGTSTNFDNRGIGCQTWTVTYTNSGFSVISLRFESATDSSGTPGTFGAFAGTVTSGINPNTAITQNISQFTGYYPWLRVSLTSATGSGTVRGTFYGWRTAAPPASGGSSGPSSNVNVAQIAGTNTVTGGVAGVIATGGPDASGTASTTNPLQLGSLDSAGNVLKNFTCTLSAVINTSSSGNTELVALGSSKIVRVCKIVLVAASPVTVTFAYGTGTACATGQTSLTGAMAAVTALALDDAGLRTAASNAFCIVLGSGVSTQGYVTYAQY